MMREWLSAQDIADELQVDIKSVRGWPKLRIPLRVYLPPGNKREWRCRRRDLNEWIEDTWEQLPVR